MTTPTATDPVPVELDDATAAAAGSIADRLRHQPIEKVIAVGERTGWWSPELVEWVADGRQGLPPAATPQYLTLRGEEQQRLDELQEQLADAGVVEPEVATAEPEPSPAAQPTPSRHFTDDPSTPVDGSAYIAVLQARDLGVDHSYQRPLDEARVARMAADWNPRMLGTIDVSDRGPDAIPRYAVVNGQHRASAAARVSPAGADVWLPCTVHEGLDVAAEARLMHELDRTTKKLSGWDKWRARRGAADTAVLQVEAIAARHGLVVDDLPGPGAMRAYGSAEKLLARGGEQLLDTTLAVLRAAWKDSPSAYQAPLVTGVGSLLQVYGASVDVERLSRALAATRPEQLRASATALRDVDGGALHELMTRAIATQYNRTSGPGARLGGSRG